MTPTKKSSEILHDALLEATELPAQWTFDVMHNAFGWLRLNNTESLRPAAKALAECGARLCTMTAYVEERGENSNKKAIAYHFALGNSVVTVTVPLYTAGCDTPVAVPSITPWFRNADWNEREFHEMFGIDIVDHPNPKRLFLDERLDAGIMSSLIPFSAMVHGAATRNLWEQVMAAKGVDITGSDGSYGLENPHLNPADICTPPVEEPKFTPVSATAPASEQ